MELMNAITGRRSIRRYTEQAVSAEQLAEIVEAARFAPSWKNSQTARYHAVIDTDLKNRIADEGTMNFSKNRLNIRAAAALVILTTTNGICGYEPDGSFTTTKGTHWQSFDAGIACQTFCLAAHEKGLGTLIMGIFNENAVKEIAGIPDGESVSALIAVGYPDEEPTMPKRLAAADILTIH